MREGIDNRQARRWVGWLLVISSIIAPLFVIEDYLFRRARLRRPWSWSIHLLDELLYWYLWAAVVPLLLYLSRRFPVDGPRRWRNLAIHLALCLVFSVAEHVVYLVLDCRVNQMLGETCAIPELVTRSLGNSMTMFNVVLYTLLVFAIHAIEYARRFHAEALNANRLREQLARAQLEALRMQLQPHFLYNSFNAISALMFRDVHAANRMLVRLSELLRSTLAYAGHQELPLRIELGFLERYLEIEQVRFGDRLTIRWDVDPGALDASVPNLILQPLAENAIRHGIAARVGAGRLELEVHRRDGQLCIGLFNEGPPLAGRCEKQEGVGLANTRARLEQLYGNDHRFSIEDSARGGVEVRLVLPYREAPDLDGRDETLASPSRPGKSSAMLEPSDARADASSSGNGARS